MNIKLYSHWHRKMQSIRSEIHDLVRTTQRSNGNRDEGREPMKTTEDKLKLSGKKKKIKAAKSNE